MKPVLITQGKTMSFDKAIADLTAAMNANTEAAKALAAALQANGGSAAAPAASTAPAATETKEEKAEAPAKATRGRGRAAAAKEDAYTPKYTQSEMQAAVNEVKTEFGTAEAKRLIKEVGGHDRLADVIDPKKIDELYEASRKMIEGEGGEGDEDEGL